MHTPTLPAPSEGVKTGKPRRTRKAKGMTPYGYDLAYGDDTAAQPGMVLFRISCEGKILVEMNMPPDEFLSLAHTFEVVARAVLEFTQPKD